MSDLFKRVLKRLNLVDRYKRQQRIRKRLPVLHYFETHLVDHCNLDCMGCTHYSPIAEEFFVNVEDFRRDFEELSKKIRFNSVRLMGGEPLLHPEINQFIKIARNCFPKSRLAIVTNGILLHKMPDSFWQTCRDNNVVIDLSEYTPTKDILPEFIKLIEGNGIIVGNVHPGQKMYFFHNQFGSSDIKEAFKNCSRKNLYKLNVLRNSKMYTCPKTAYIDIYNKRYGVKVPQDKGINIYKYSGRKIVEYLKRPVSTCAYCLYLSFGKAWEVSKKLQNEWNAFSNRKIVSKAQAKSLEYLKRKKG